MGIKCLLSFEEVRDMVLDGNTYAEIARRCGVSRQRVQQIISPPRHIMAKVKERAQGRCEDCGILIHKGAHLHHVNGDKIDPVKFNGIENIKYLCLGCHRKEHRQHDKKCPQCQKIFYGSSTYCSPECRALYRALSRSQTVYNIKSLRESLKLTQEELAKQLIVTVSTVQKWEIGRNKPGKLAQRQIKKLERKLKKRA